MMDESVHIEPVDSEPDEPEGDPLPTFDELIERYAGRLEAGEDRSTVARSAFALLGCEVIPYTQDGVPREFRVLRSGWWDSPALKAAS
jgi:hypothetical protein